jgi:hypothetical protein
VRNLIDVARMDYLRLVLDQIADEVGVDRGASPDRVLEGAQRLREALARARGYPSTPHGLRPPLRERGW